MHVRSLKSPSVHLLLLSRHPITVFIADPKDKSEQAIIPIAEYGQRVPERHARPPRMGCLARRFSHGKFRS